MRGDLQETGHTVPGTPQSPGRCSRSCCCRSVLIRQQSSRRPPSQSPCTSPILHLPHLSSQLPSGLSACSHHCHPHQLLSLSSGFIRSILFPVSTHIPPRLIQNPQVFSVSENGTVDPVTQKSHRWPEKSSVRSDRKPSNRLADDPRFCN